MCTHCWSQRQIENYAQTHHDQSQIIIWLSACKFWIMNGFFMTLIIRVQRPFIGWLKVQLQSARKKGKKSSHLLRTPPGFYHTHTLSCKYWIYMDCFLSHSIFVAERESIEMLTHEKQNQFQCETKEKTTDSSLHEVFAHAFHIIKTFLISVNSSHEIIRIVRIYMSVLECEGNIMTWRYLDMHSTQHTVYVLLSFLFSCCFTSNH